MTSLLAALALVAQPPARPGSELTAPGKHVRTVVTRSEAAFELRWRRPVVRTGLFREVGVSFGQPAVSRAHGLVVVGQGEGEVWAVTLEEGEPVWRHRHGAPFETAATLVEVFGASGIEELVIVPARDGKILALEVADGRLRWTSDVGAEVRAPAAVVQTSDPPRIVVTTAANTVHALDATSGKTLWSANRPPPRGLPILGHARPTVARDVVYTGFSDGYVEAYALGTGARLWSRPLSLSGSGFVDADADPLVLGNRLFVASYSEGIFALDPESGRTLWSRPAPAVVSLAESGPFLVAGSADGWLWAVRQTDGSLVYRTKLPPGPLSRLAVRDGLIVATAGETGLVVLDAASGKPIQAAGVGDRLASDPMWSGNDLCLLSSGGYLYAFARAR